MLEMKNQLACGRRRTSEFFHVAASQSLVTVVVSLDRIRRHLSSEAEVDRRARKLLIPTPAMVHVAWCCHSSLWLLLKILAP